eukprot:TRINITY_DN2_c5_g1_i1.p1 TRINITY_DN2_c5_g1~~TRINITY_DN2_c5_g1_i1.p1  ORF type:complete len:488 (-),score=62.57 TRINITY_DN2_c5_g1_i1:145-1608(-)
MVSANRSAQRTRVGANQTRQIDKMETSSTFSVASSSSTLSTSTSVYRTPPISKLNFESADVESPIRSPRTRIPSFIRSPVQTRPSPQSRPSRSLATSSVVFAQPQAPLIPPFRVSYRPPLLPPSQPQPQPQPSWPQVTEQVLQQQQLPLLQQKQQQQQEEPQEKEHQSDRLTVVAPPPLVQSTTMTRKLSLYRCCRIFLPVVVAVLALLLGMIVYGKYVPAPVHYCPSVPDATIQPPHSCAPCPLHGICDQSGNLQCVKGYVLDDGRCVEDETIDVLARRMRRVAAEILNEQHVNEFCSSSSTHNQTSTASKSDRMFHTELHRKLVERMTDIPNDLSSSQIFTKMENAINTDLQLSRHSDISITDRFYSITSPSLPWGCWPYFFFIRHVATIFSIVLIFVITGIVMWKFSRNRKQKLEVARVCAKIYARLNEQRGAPFARANLKDEFNVPDFIWSKVEAEIDKNSCVAKQVVEFAGISRQSWIWIAS